MQVTLFYLVIRIHYENKIAYYYIFEKFGS